MKNKELQELLKGYPDDMPIKLLLNVNSPKEPIKDFDSENILHSSETAFLNADAPEDEWDSEDGRFELGDGEQYLLINPVIY
jgi:hypothetical protein